MASAPRKAGGANSAGTALNKPTFEPVNIASAGTLIATAMLAAARLHLHGWRMIDRAKIAPDTMVRASNGNPATSSTLASQKPSLPAKTSGDNAAQ